VMGHTQCGAVGATVRALENRGGPESSNLQSIVDRIAPQVAHVLDEVPGYESRVAAAVSANALASARELRRSSPILTDLVSRGRVLIVAAVYDLATGRVTFLEKPAESAASLTSV
jgi:carbonic anhydrase